MARLNRLQYTNAIRDLFGLEIDGAAMLPRDDSGFGFDNITDLLKMSPSLLDRYMLAAEKISRMAVGDMKQKPMIVTTKNTKAARRCTACIVAGRMPAAASSARGER